MKANTLWKVLPRLSADLDAVEQLAGCPVLGDYLEEEGVARHAPTGRRRDVLDLALQAGGTRRKSVL